MEKFFKLKERGTTVSKEIVGGITTFLAMAYILAVNPGMLSETGVWKSTCSAGVCFAPHAVNPKNTRTAIIFCVKDFILLYTCDYYANIIIFHQQPTNWRSKD